MDSERLHKYRQVKHGVFLDVPLLERAAARAVGGKWDARLQTWYVPRGMDPRPFRRWYRARTARAPRAHAGLARSGLRVESLDIHR